MWSFISDLPVYLFLAALGGGISTFFIVAFINMTIMPFRKIKKIQDAIDNGRVIEAKLKTYKYPFDSSTERYIWGYYTYEYQNRLYSYTGKFVATPPDTLNLYYQKNPAKAKTLHKFGCYMEEGITTIFAVMTVIMFFVSIVVFG